MYQVVTRKTDNMFNTNQFTGKNLEGLVRIALTHRELSPGVAAAIKTYRVKPQLTNAEERQLAILDSAIADGCIVPIMRA
ncbi:hypothetical protein [Leptothoe kymatousa]|uniref:Uncharacterized protein n=1 Tax=Leptothoe kymatousa TAU-MAC 1615 TaxID=2364775 RepID=A0ABS5XYR6_9CYAN|nr:hypothetical protein [Leptothoe kymatousa]MBT9310772.1 hypothetical protein [Leptothoe kymatousa TAU-MAC 1615]